MAGYHISDDMSYQSRPDEQPWTGVQVSPRTFGPSTAVGPFILATEHHIHLLQQPNRAKVVIRGKERDRRPVDPPPVIQLHVNDPHNNTCSFVHNPYYFCTVALWEAELDRAQSNPDRSNTRLKDTELLVGSLVSSLHRLKHQENTEQGVFVFGDLSVAIIGRFRLRFCLYKMLPDTNDVHHLYNILSAPFQVTGGRDWTGVRESTLLSRTLADQGIKLKLSKEPRQSSKRGYDLAAESDLAPQMPSQPCHPQAEYNTNPSHESSTQASPQQGYQQSTNDWGQPPFWCNTMANQQSPSGSYLPPTTLQPSNRQSHDAIPVPSYYRRHSAFFTQYGYSTNGYSTRQAQEGPLSSLSQDQTQQTSPDQQPLHDL